MKYIQVESCSVCPFKECMTHGVFCEKKFKCIGLYSDEHMSMKGYMPEWCPLSDTPFDIKEEE